MADLDPARIPGLLARLDTIAACPVHVRDDLSGMHDACVDASAAIRALMAEARASGVRLADLSKSEIEIAVAAEREECARMCNERAEQIAASEPKTIEAATEYEVWLQAARAIRARGAA